MILYDRLIPDGALDGPARTRSWSTSASRAAGASVPQEQTEALMIERARAGALVVRLKGGDPFVFGRGGEEALALRAAGIAFEIVPGVTAGIAAPAYAGIPVTQRGLASAVALITGHEDPAKAEQALDWDALAAFPGRSSSTWGCARLAAIARALIDAGRDAQEPAAVVEAGTLPGQRTVRAPLAKIAERAAAQADRVSGGDRRGAGRASSPPRSPGAARARSAGARSPSRARAPRPARWRGACASSGRG